MDHPKSVGARSTLAIMLALQRTGHVILLPFGENTRYDLVIDAGGRLSRIQCKTGRLRHGARSGSRSAAPMHNHPNPRLARRDYLGEVDYFAVYCPETGGVFLIPVRDVPLRCQGALRVTPPRNNQSRRVRHAAPYEIANFGPEVS